MTSANVQVSIAGAGVVSGPVSVPFGASIQLSASNTTGWTAALWQLVDYPPGMGCPAGWSTDAQGVYYFQPSNPTALPPAFNAPAAGPTNWGKIPVRLRVNGNPLQLLANDAPNPAYNPALTDTATVLSIKSANLGMEGVGSTENIQWDALRSWDGPLMRMLRLLDVACGGTMVYMAAATNITVAQSGTVFLVDTSAGGFESLLPTPAQLAAANNAGDNLWWEFVDTPLTATGGHALGLSGWANNNFTLGGNGTNIVDPNYVGQDGRNSATTVLSTARGRFRFTYSVKAGLFLP